MVFNVACRYGVSSKNRTELVFAVGFIGLLSLNGDGHIRNRRARSENGYHSCLFEWRGGLFVVKRGKNLAV
jgi:hypothetical protein